MTELITYCLCGDYPLDTITTRYGIPMRTCSECGIQWQQVKMTLDEYANWYATRYHDGVYTHTYEHDRKIAKLRLAAYGLDAGSQILDVGCGNNAFVDEARAQGVLAFGQDHAQQANARFTYAKSLYQCAFPTGHFDAVTMHDVLEHVPDLTKFLREVRRILKPGGRFLLDWPSFHAANGAGAHHWKQVEHLWMLTDDQVQRVLLEEGFAVQSLAHPLPSRSVFQTIAQPVKDAAKILVPAGIGDGYWVATKLRGFIEQERLHLPEIYVHDTGPRRSDEFWRSIPFVRFAGYHPLPPKTPYAARAFTQRGFVVQRDVPGMDYFISMNGALESGQTVDQAMQGPTDWYPTLFHSKEEDQFRDHYKAKYGSYVVVAFWDKGFYQKWLREFSIRAIVMVLQSILMTGRKVVIMGAEWDKEGITQQIAAYDKRFISIVGSTSYTQMIGLIRGASGVFGFPAGNTLFGAFLQRPTLILWNRHFRQEFWRNVCPPRAPHYRAMPTTSSPQTVARNLFQMLGTT